MSASPPMPAFEPPFGASSLLSQAARDPSLLAAFAEAYGEVRHGDEVYRLSWLTSDDEQALHHSALPILYGLAVAASLLKVGLAGRWLAERYDAETVRREALREEAEARALSRSADDEFNRQLGHDRRIEAVIQKHMRGRDPGTSR